MKDNKVRKRKEYEKRLKYGRKGKGKVCLVGGIKGTKYWGMFSKLMKIEYKDDFKMLGRIFTPVL